MPIVLCRALPRLFGTNLDNIPAPIPYVKADPAKVEHWRRRIDTLVPKGYRRSGRGLGRAGRPTAMISTAPCRCRSWVHLAPSRRRRLAVGTDGSGPGRDRPLFRPGAADQFGGRDPGLRRHDGDLRMHRPAGRRRYGRRPSGRCHGQAGLDPGAVRAGLALAAGPDRYALVPDRYPASPGGARSQWGAAIAKMLETVRAEIA